MMGRAVTMAMGSVMPDSVQLVNAETSSKGAPKKTHLTSRMPTPTNIPELDKEVLELPLSTTKGIHLTPRSNVSKLVHELDFLDGMITYMNEIQDKADKNEYKMLMPVTRAQWEEQRQYEIDLFNKEKSLILRYVQYISFELESRGIILIVSGGAGWNYYTKERYPIADLDLTVYSLRDENIMLDETRDLIESLTRMFLKNFPDYENYDFSSVSNYSIHSEIRKNPSMMRILDSIQDPSTLSKTGKKMLAENRDVLLIQAKLDRLNPSKFSKKIDGRWNPLVEFSFTDGPIVPRLNVMFVECPTSKLKYLSLIELSFKLLNNLKKNDGDIEVRLTGGETNITSRKLQSWKEQAEFLRDIIKEYV